jgi:site-specific DNA-methyltransferase (cytosine-N4-specific)
MITIPAYTTGFGAAYCGDSLDLLAELPDASVNLVVTSPPFALQRQKAYGNQDQAEYVEWLAQFARQVYRVLKDDGSFVLDLGGAYEKGVPVRSLYNFRVLIKFRDEIGFYLAQDFYWFNPSKLPSPIEWVNKRKLRVKDAVNPVWWFSKTAWPKADVTGQNPESERVRGTLGSLCQGGVSVEADSVRRAPTLADVGRIQRSLSRRKKPSTEGQQAALPGGWL